MGRNIEELISFYRQGYIPDAVLMQAISGMGWSPLIELRKLLQPRHCCNISIIERAINESFNKLAPKALKQNGLSPKEQAPQGNKPQINKRLERAIQLDKEKKNYEEFKEEFKTVEPIYKEIMKPVTKTLIKEVTQVVPIVKEKVCHDYELKPMWDRDRREYVTKQIDKPKIIHYTTKETHVKKVPYKYYEMKTEKIKAGERIIMPDPDAYTPDWKDKRRQLTILGIPATVENLKNADQLIPKGNQEFYARLFSKENDSFYFNKVALSLSYLGYRPAGPKLGRVRREAEEETPANTSAAPVQQLTQGNVTLNCLIFLATTAILNPYAVPTPISELSDDTSEWLTYASQMAIHRAEPETLLVQD